MGTNSTRPTWSGRLQNAVNNHYVGADQLGDLKEITNPNANTVVITLAAESAAVARWPAMQASCTTRKAKPTMRNRRSDQDHSPCQPRTNRKSCCNATTRIGDKKAASSQVTPLLLRQRGIHGRDAMKAGKISMALPLSASTASELGKPTVVVADSGISSTR